MFHRGGEIKAGSYQQQTEKKKTNASTKRTNPASTTLTSAAGVCLNYTCLCIVEFTALTNANGHPRQDCEIECTIVHPYALTAISYRTIFGLGILA